MAHVIVVHGVSVARRPDWWLDWARHVEVDVTKPVHVWRPITWEPASDATYRIRSRTSWFLRRFGVLRDYGDLLHDLAAVIGGPPRQYVIDHVTEAVHDAENAKASVWVIGHSLGSVLAYFALHTLDGPRIAKFITLGSPLSFAYRYGFRIAFPEPRKPPCVRRWQNVYGRMDMIGGRVAAADQNIAVCCRHDSNRYLQTHAVRRLLGSVGKPA